MIKPEDDEERYATMINKALFWRQPTNLMKLVCIIYFSFSRVDFYFVVD